MNIVFLAGMMSFIEESCSDVHQNNVILFLKA